MKHIFIGMVVFWGLALSYAQSPLDINSENTDDLGNVTDEFQELFFQAISQSAINNYSKAIDLLQKCSAIDDTQAAVYFLLGKNYRQENLWQSSEEAFIKALSLSEAKNIFNIRTQLFELYVDQKMTAKAIEQALILAKTDQQYKQELANLYLINNQPQKALEVLDQIEQYLGFSDYRDQLRLNIYMSSAKFKTGQDYFTKRINQNTKDLNAYLAVLEILLVQEDYAQIVDIGAQAKQNIGLSDEVEPYLSKAFIALNQAQKAKQSVKAVVQSRLLNEAVKLETIKVYKTFTAQSSTLQQDLLEVLNSAISTEKASASKAELAVFYKDRDPAKAYDYFKQALDNKPQDFKLLKEVISLGLVLGEFTEVLNYANMALELFPSQAQFYYAKSAALFEQEKTQEALSQLEMGFSLLVGQKELAQQFHQLYVNIYQKLDNPEQLKYHQQQLNN